MSKQIWKELRELREDFIIYKEITDKRLEELSKPKKVVKKNEPK